MSLVGGIPYIICLLLSMEVRHFKSRGLLFFMIVPLELSNYVTEGTSVCLVLKASFANNQGYVHGYGKNNSRVSQASDYRRSGKVLGFVGNMQSFLSPLFIQII